MKLLFRALFESIFDLITPRRAMLICLPLLCVVALFALWDPDQTAPRSAELATGVEEIVPVAQVDNAAVDANAQNRQAPTAAIEQELNSFSGETDVESSQVSPEANQADIESSPASIETSEADAESSPASIETSEANIEFSQISPQTSLADTESSPDSTQIMPEPQVTESNTQAESAALVESTVPIESTVPVESTAPVVSQAQTVPQTETVPSAQTETNNEQIEPPSDEGDDASFLDAPAEVDAAAGPMDMERLVIPAIDLDVPVAELGWHSSSDRSGLVFNEWDVADSAAGWHIDSAKPGEGGNVVMSGHNNVLGAVFRELDQLNQGDQAFIYSGDRVHLYAIEQVFIVPEIFASEEQRVENAKWIDSFDDDRLTLVSCWPRDDNSHRIIVVGRAVDG